MSTHDHYYYSVSLHIYTYLNSKTLGKEMLILVLWTLSTCGDLVLPGACTTIGPALEGQPCWGSPC